MLGSKGGLLIILLVYIGTRSFSYSLPGEVTNSWLSVALLFAHCYRSLTCIIGKTTQQTIFAVQYPEGVVSCRRVCSQKFSPAPSPSSSFENNNSTCDPVDSKIFKKIVVEQKPNGKGKKVEKRSAGDVFLVIICFNNCNFIRMCRG